MSMSIGALMDMIDVTIVNVALPTIRRDLHTGATQLEWVISGYMLAFAAGLIVAGNLGDRFGRKRIFLLGVGFFGLASLCAGLSVSGPELIAARVVQGAAAAAMTPQVLATFRAIFAAGERGKAFGVYGAMLGFASAIGLVLGGVLTAVNLFGWSWRSVFFINVPVAACALIAGARAIPETPLPAGPTCPAPSCWPARSSPSCTRCSRAVSSGGPRGCGRCSPPAWPACARWACSSTGGPGSTSRRCCGPGCSGFQRSRPGSASRPRSRPGCRASSSPLRCGCRSASTSPPLKAGLTSVAFSVGSFIGAPAAVPLAQRYGRRVLASGAALMVAGIIGVAMMAGHVGVDGSPWPIVPGLVVAGAGLALLVVPLVNVVLAAVPVEVAGGASGLFSTAQQLGGALGVALLGTVFFGYLGGHGFEAALVHAAPYAIGAFALCCLLSMLLPRTAVAEEVLTGS
jgi:MFS family permease